MALFRKKQDEDALALEKLVNSIMFSGDAKLSVPVAGKDNKTADFGFYLLPIEAHNQCIFGILEMDKELVETPIGFLHKYGFAHKHQYVPTMDGALMEIQHHNDFSFIPLKPTSIRSKVKDEDKGLESVSLMGIDGRQGLYPLILISNSHDARMLIGIIQKGNALLGTAFTGTQNTEKAYALLSSLKDKQKLLAGKEGELPLLSDEEQIDWEKPPAIVEYLDKYVIKQDNAKHIMAVAFSDYLARMKAKAEDMPVGHVLLVGPTGVGKTLSIETLAKKAGVPFIRTTCTSKSVDGYTGEHLSMVFNEVREKTQGEAPYCVVLFDELDKTVWGEGFVTAFGPRIQDCLIGWIDGVIVQGDRMNQMQKSLGLSTRNMLFVFAGAFTDNGDMSLEDIVRKRVCKHEKKVGFGVEHKKEGIITNIMQHLSPEDMIKYGLKAELVGRIPWLAVLERLSVEDKTKILLESRRSPLKHSIRLLELKGYRTRVDDDVPRYIAECCPEETGARALYSICNNLFTEIRFAPEKYADNKMVIRVTLEMAKELITLYGKKG